MSYRYTFKPSPDDDEIAYLAIDEVEQTRARTVAATKRLRDVFGPYTGPDLFLDFDEDGKLLGVEIIT